MRKELVTHFIPKAPESEMFRNLRTNIQFMNSEKPLKTLMVTSTMPREGKSYVSANLAVVFAQAGNRVILVDCDMRKGRQFNIFDVLPRPGISNYLSGVVETDFKGDPNDVSNYIQDTQIENLRLVVAGNIPPNPSELINLSRMHTLIEKLKEQSDIVIFDAPPAIIVSDAAILARQVDSCVIIAACNQTKMEDIERVKDSIEKVGAKIAGVVMNKVPTTGKDYNGMYYYYGTNAQGKKMKKKKKRNENRRKSVEENIGKIVKTGKRKRKEEKIEEIEKKEKEEQEQEEKIES